MLRVQRICTLVTISHRNGSIRGYLLDATQQHMFCLRGHVCKRQLGHHRLLKRLMESQPRPPQKTTTERDLTHSQAPHPKDLFPGSLSSSCLGKSKLASKSLIFDGVSASYFDRYCMWRAA